MRQFFLYTNVYWSEIIPLISAVSWKYQRQYIRQKLFYFRFRRVKGATAAVVSTAIALIFTNLIGHDFCPIPLHSPLIVFVSIWFDNIYPAFIHFICAASLCTQSLGGCIYFRICVIVNAKCWIHYGALIWIGVGFKPTTKKKQMKKKL